jgi:hypothetical protein
MAATRNDIKALAKERYPSAATIQLKRFSDFQTLGIAGKDGDHPDWLLTIDGGKNAIEYKADTLELLHAMLSAK